MRPLHIAINFGLGAIAAYLLLKGADGDARDGDDRTPLHLCAAGPGEQTQIAALLIKRGASLKARLPTAESVDALGGCEEDSECGYDDFVYGGEEGERCGQVVGEVWFV